MTKDEAIKKLKEIQNDTENDEEFCHINADNVLCDLLETLGYKEVVDEWDKIKKWYA